MCSEIVNSSCSTSDTRRVTLVPVPLIGHEIGMDDEIVTTTNGTHPCLSETHVFLND